MATREEIMNRLIAAQERALESGLQMPLAQVAEVFRELAVILAENEARIDELEAWRKQHDHDVEGLP